jgi:hypothetical protein
MKKLWLKKAMIIIAAVVIELGAAERAWGDIATHIHTPLFL